MDKLGVTMPTRTCALDKVPEYARLADEAGMHSVWSYELYRNPFAMLCTSAMATSRTLLATGLAAGFSRSPFEAANAAADVDELSDGRMLFGLGTGVPEFLQAFHSTDMQDGVARLGEYVDVVRLAWQYLATDAAEPYHGKHYTFEPPPFNPWGSRNIVRERIPIYMAGMRPRLLGLTGEKADGWIGYLTTPKFLEENVIPGIEAGTKRAGRDISELDLAAEVICVVHPDRDIAMQRAKQHVGFYMVHPVSDIVVNLHGLSEQQGALRQALMSEGFGALANTDEALVETFSITGTPEEARQKLADYDSFQHLVLHTPYIPPLTAEESEDCFEQIVSAFGEVATAMGTGAATAAS